MAAPKIDPTTLYKVELTKSVKIGRLMITPSNGTRIRGDALAVLIDQDKDAVKNYEAV
ncbi:hypothetical protein KQ944_18040 [Bacillus subtilis]|uniref:hypothetical protein n=1 Tax=Pseudochrobactrum asaccharolyticum TaxID=354351 RepID=UPI001F218A7C|nr:hypothetical protein [Pseudochrobactrum asaccharolyticum]MCF7646898.1 hypothetical protein [Pseudochrobactrum asaccharolyticum]MCF7673540.1 hypothetical protein [Bacillus subtilis]